MTSLPSQGGFSHSPWYKNRRSHHHHGDFVDVLSLGFEELFKVPQTWSTYSHSAAEQIQSFPLVKLDRTLQLLRTDLRVGLRRVDSRVSQHRSNRFEVVVRFENLHSDTVAEIMRLQHRVADEAP